MVSTEVLMGFLAAWGLVQGFGPIWVPLGLGLAYALNALGVAVVARWGRRAALIGAIITIVAAFSSSLSTTEYRWWMVCIAAGGLLSFRDQQTIHSLAWMPLRAHRRGGNSLMALAAGAILSATLLAICLISAGFLAQIWPSLPHVIALVACVFLLPTQVWRTRARPVRQLKAGNLQLASRPQLHWLFRLSLLFNSVNFLGRRIVLPMAIWIMAREQGWDKEALPLLGGALGLMGLVGMLLRTPFAISKRAQGEALLSWGARMSLLGWAFIGLGAALMPVLPLAWIALMCGWVLLEITNKTWATGYMEALRANAVGNRITYSRAHRVALWEFMSFKSAGGAIGCSLAAALTPAAAPLLVAALAMGCWWWLENPPTSSSSQAK